MAQVSHGTITISDITDINDLITEYCRVRENVELDEEENYIFNSSYFLTLDTEINSEKNYYIAIVDDDYVTYELVNNPVVENITDYYELESNEYAWNEQIPTWISGYQIWVRKARDIEGIGIEYSQPYIYKLLNQLVEIDTRNQQYYENLQHKMFTFWWNAVGRFNGEDGWTKPDYPAGAYAAGVSMSDLDYEDSETYGHNIYLGGNVLSLRYKNINLNNLRQNQMTFFYPTVEEGNLVQGDRGLQISAEGINIFSSDQYNQTTDTEVQLDKLYYNLQNNEYIPNYTITNNDLISGSYYEHSKALSIGAGGIHIYNGTIGDINITDTAIFSGDTTASEGTGFYLGKNGEFYIGNATGDKIILDDGQLSIYTDRIFGSTNHVPIVKQLTQTYKLLKDVGVIAWIEQNGVFAQAQTPFDENKMYFIQNNDGQWSYVENPSAENLNQYFEYTNGAELAIQLQNRFGNVEDQFTSTQNTINNIDSQRQVDYTTWDEIINGRIIGYQSAAGTTFDSSMVYYILDNGKYIKVDNPNAENITNYYIAERDNVGILSNIDKLQRQIEEVAEDKYAPFFEIIQNNNNIESETISDVAGLRLGVKTNSTEEEVFLNASYIELKVIQSEEEEQNSELSFTFYQKNSPLLYFRNNRGVIPELVTKSIYFANKAIESGSGAGVGIGWVARENGHVCLKRVE